MFKSTSPLVRRLRQLRVHGRARLADLEEWAVGLKDDFVDAVGLLVRGTTGGGWGVAGVSGGIVMMSAGGPGDPSPAGSNGKEDEDDLDFVDEVLDIEDDGLDPASSASAIEGVQPLDFLDDDAPEPPRPPSEAPPAASAEREAEDAEIDDVGEFLDEPVEEFVAEPMDELESEASQADDEEGWNFDELAAGDGDGESPPAAPASSEPTVRHAEKTAAFTAPETDEWGAPPGVPEASIAENTAEVEELAEDESAEDEDMPSSFPTDSTPSPAAGSPAAPTIQPGSLAAKPRRKKSAAPMLAVAAGLILVLAGAGVGGLYVAGMLPGFGGGQPPVAVVGDGDENDAVPGAEDGLARGRRIREHTNELTAIVQAAKPGGGEIDGDKLSEAQDYLQRLAEDEADMLEDEMIAALQGRVAALAGEYQQQLEKQAQAQRVEEFRAALDTAQSLMDRGLLGEARRLAQTPDEQNLVAALEKEIDDLERRQEAEAAAAAEAARQKADALAAVVAGVTDAEVYRLSLDAYIKAHPEDARSADFEKALAADVEILIAVQEWNRLLDAWSRDDLGKLSPQQAAQRAADGEEGLRSLGQLPGAADVESRLPALQAIAAREKNGKKALDTLVQYFDNPAAKASLVLGTQDGKRYYLAERPGRKDDKLLLKYVADLEGTIEEVEIAPGEVDRDATGPTILAETAQRVRGHLAATDEAGWEAAFLSAVIAVQAAQPADEKIKPLDPTVQALWLAMLLEFGRFGSRPLATATEAARAELNEIGIRELAKWPDPVAAAQIREKCALALSALPDFGELQAAVEADLQALNNFAPAERIVPMGVLLRDEEADGDWAVALAAAAPDAATLKILVAGSPEDALAILPIGAIEGASAYVDEDADRQALVEGRVVYTVAPAPADDQAPPDAEPADTEPADAEPFDEKPLDVEPFDVEPFDAEPFDEKPFDAEPVEVESTGVE